MEIETTLKNLDSPIQAFEEDLLQRRGFVESLCQIFEAGGHDESTVFALYGEWGSGKSSVKNLLIKMLTEPGGQMPRPIEFNPWAFSGQDQVLEAFFSEIGKSLGSGASNRKVAEGFKKLGAYLSFGAKTAKTIHLGLDLFGVPGAKLVGLVGEQLEGSSKSTKEYGEDIGAAGSASLEKVQRDLRTALSKLDRPLLIILDDLDRLTPDQLLLVFQIVKLNANLPRVNYLLLMDAETITERLKIKGLGPEFIEKIVQFELALPHTSAQELKGILKDGFQAVMGKYASQIDWDRWEEVWTNCCENLFTTLRRIKRFLRTLKFHVGLFASEDVLEVDPVDLFSLEALRKFAPEVHTELPRVLADAVYRTRSFMRLMLMPRDDEAKFGQIELDRLVALAPLEIKNEVEHLLRAMFPQIGRGYSDHTDAEWIQGGRICHELFFESYFRLAIPRQLPSQQEIKALFDSCEDAQRLRQSLSTIYAKVGLHPLLVRIQSHHNQLKPESLPCLLTELWRLDELDAREAGIERKWDTRDATQAITRFLLMTFCPAETRVSLFLQTLRVSGALYAAARFVQSEIGDLKERAYSTDRAFDQPRLAVLQTEMVNAIHKAAEAGTILDAPDSHVLLLLWARLESVEAVTKWLSQTLKDASRLPLILARFVAKSTSTGNRGTKVTYWIPRRSLESFIPLDESLESQLRGLNVAELPHWEKFAVEQTLKRIDEKRNGVQEAEYDN